LFPLHKLGVKRRRLGAEILDLAGIFRGVHADIADSKGLVANVHVDGIAVDHAGDVGFGAIGIGGDALGASREGCRWDFSGRWKGIGWDQRIGGLDCIGGNGGIGRSGRLGSPGGEGFGHCGVHGAWRWRSWVWRAGCKYEEQNNSDAYFSDWSTLSGCPEKNI
jgi:hypothetical protein